MVCFAQTTFSLFYMGMVADMILTVAVIAAAAGTVAELQIRMACISTTADGTLVGVICLLSGRRGFLCGCIGEGDHLGAILLVVLTLLFAQSLQLDKPGSGNHI